ncbi:CGNR zinc finger domain-containing protein [Streptomyces sp. NPDC046275]|uniref:CGNR zinc finger domain-containing protein n=1 Tax=Streptomyces sp. NPDC046275 TaxID=3157201 RepID=UPI0033D1D347
MSAGLLTDRLSLRACLGAACGRLFLAESDRRSWCSPATCGARGRDAGTRIIRAETPWLRPAARHRLGHSSAAARGGPREGDECTCA